MVPLEEIRAHGYCVLPRIVNLDTIEMLREAFGADETGYTEHVDIDASTPRVDVWLSLVELEPFRSMVVSLIGSPFETRLHGRNPLLGGGQQGLHSDLHPGGALAEPRRSRQFGCSTTSPLTTAPPEWSLARITEASLCRDDMPNHTSDIVTN